MTESQFKALERKIDELITLCTQLDKENRSLKADTSSWQHERDQLLGKNELARSKVETMIERLKTLEQGS
jgi:cell division protein ZapB